MSGLNLAAIADALWELQLAFASINRELDSRRKSLDDEVVVNMIDGYAFIDQLLTDRIDLFALGNSSYWLKINAIVLCGRTAASAESNRRMLQAAESRFYDDARGGFRDIMDWYSFNLGTSVWWRAAGVYVHLLSEPQLFLEGNHRTGALIISYMLAREGRAPFVLTRGNAREFLKSLFRDQEQQTGGPHQELQAASRNPLLRRISQGAAESTFLKLLTFGMRRTPGSGRANTKPARKLSGRACRPAPP